jgi:hypothetical protein
MKPKPNPNPKPKRKAEKIKSAGGRPTRLTEELQETVVNLLRQGNYVSVVAKYCKLSTSTIFMWCRLGRSEQERLESGLEPDPTSDMYMKFFVAVEQAQAFAEIKDNQLLVQAADKDPRVVMWRLERRNPKRWGGREFVDVDVTAKATTKNTKYNLETLSMEDRQSLLLLIEKMRKPKEPIIELEPAGVK